MRSWLAVAVFACASCASLSARAEDPPAPRVTVSFQGAGDAVLQERRTDAAEWTRVCELPCEGSVTSAPWARHRVLPGERAYPVGLGGVVGAHATVRYAEGSPGARTGLVVTGGLLATTGVALVAAGLIRSIEVGEAAPGTPQDRAPQYLALGGLGSLVAGGIVVLVGVALGETRVSVGP